MKAAVVIPCFKAKNSILSVIQQISSDISEIYVVDDCCPENTGQFISENCLDNRVILIKHEKNQGVGGAVISGIKAALKAKADIIVKIDSDGQMDPGLIPKFIEPILLQRADYTKGNRFYKLEYLHQMPKIRLLGNTILSFICKASSGYWSIMDPTNGYVAIHAKVAAELPLEKLSKRYFFESDMLFRLNIARAVVEDIPMSATYANESSNLSIFKTLIEFPWLYLNRFIKRIFYSYFLRGFNAGSIMFIFGSILTTFGAIFGCWNWYQNSLLQIFTSTGTVMIAVLPIVLGFQLLLGAIQIDIQSEPKDSIHNKL